MSLLSNNNTNNVIADGILTKYGKEKLAEDGNLDITKFALSDDGIDYSLYNVLHPMGSEFYGIALQQMPIIQPLPFENLNMRYLLFTEEVSKQIAKESKVEEDPGNTTTPPPVKRPTITYSVDVIYPSEFNSGITRTTTSYKFTPYITPRVSNSNNTVIYMAEIVNDHGLPIELTGEVDHNFALPNTLDSVTRYADGRRTQYKSRKFAVGHIFDFKIKLLPKRDTLFTVIIRPWGNYSARLKTFTILVKSREFGLDSDRKLDYYTMS